MTGEAEGIEQTSLLGLMWRYRWAVVLVVLLSVALGLFLNDLRTVDYVATANLIVEDPRASSLEVTDVARQSTQDSERYLADQVEILRSSEAATIASRLTGGELTATQIAEKRAISGDSTSNLIKISFRAQSPSIAKTGADALLDAYAELRRSQVQATAEAALAKLDALSEVIDAELTAIDTRMQELTTPDPDRLELELQVNKAIRELNALRTQRESLAVGSDERNAVNAQIDELSQDFAAWRALLDIEIDNEELTALEAEQDAALAERAALVARRNAIAVDAELAAVGVTLVSPAELPLEPAGVSDTLVMAGSVVLGLALAAMLANFLSLRIQAIVSRELPERVLQVPLLAEVPNFLYEGISSQIPVKEAPASATAEAFRFAAAAIDIRASATDARMVSMVSAVVGSGKTVTVANAGLAAAREGKRILLVDGDFSSQKLTQLLADETPKWGLTDVVDGDVHLLKAIVDVSHGDGRSVSLLARGSLAVDPASFYQSALTKEFFAHLPMLYDLVIVDCPPVLQVAYASTIAAYTEASVVVVEHSSPTKQLVELADRMELIGTPVLGYVYSKAPLRREMATGVGSTAPWPEAPATRPSGSWRSRSGLKRA